MCKTAESVTSGPEIGFERAKRGRLAGGRAKLGSFLRRPGNITGYRNIGFERAKSVWLRVTTVTGRVRGVAFLKDEHGEREI
jgi:hypothetical protein